MRGKEVRPLPQARKAPDDASGYEEVRGRIVQAGAGVDVELEVFADQEGARPIDAVLIGRALSSQRREMESGTAE